MIIIESLVNIFKFLTSYSKITLVEFNLKL
ncbi:hypothetical protein CPAL_15700 [Clostridium thermopalmarium DSM 5974]|uniref:Uncharacterized protein n=2 Tax=Clostridium TaxID=1485 RepID=A0A151APW9_9CLOT|nr:hypothetical protein CLCOL_08630 [Clostridium colicanis DSM 13634]PRR72083.1 hypothetical protein CPAL_15700 [Clostridium thermopalmarium DSM 5974]